VLLRTAGYSWRSPDFPNQRNLTGFSHGTAGAGYALLELFEATDDSKYLIAAEQAFRYERHWFDVAARNWPDLREEPAKGSRVRRPLSFTTSWCHGAPGIALSRLRAYELCNREEYRAEALTAIKTTREAVMVSLRSGVGNFSLCHGLTGNAEVLLHGCRVLGQKGVDESALALAVADLGIDTYADRGLSWPCGTGSGETPNLMLGLAGIGHIYLRLHSSETPSVLVLQREAFRN
jgi:lantibiotic modifying enzyme